VRVLAGAAGARAALDALSAAGVVAIPTDTVYGLAARLDRPDAIRELFELKGRPADVAIAVLAGSVDRARPLAAVWPPSAERLAAAFWPGPLTLVVPAARSTASVLGGSGTTVGLRVPAHALIQRLCEESGPLAVTSANLHGQPPGASAAGVAAMWPDGSERFSLVVDGGACDGVPSTVLDCTVDPPASLRVGALAWSEVQEALAGRP
jgi:L-threonylcarbamoyladenylate synthase